MAKDTIRYVNRTGDVVRLPTPRGGRLALSNGEFARDTYYARFSRLHGEHNKTGKKPLVQEYEDGTPVGADPPVDAIAIHAPVVKPHIRPTYIPPLTGCETACEGACQFPAELAPEVTEDINRAMDDDSPQDAQEVPLLNDAGETDAPAEMQPQVVEETQPPMPPPILDEGHHATDADSHVQEQKQEERPQRSLEEVMTYFKLAEQDILEVGDGFVHAKIDMKDLYLSRYELGWKTDHLPAMRRHVKAARKET